MARHITIIQGHPDPALDRFCHALAAAYAAGAEAAALEVKRIEVAKLEFPLLRTHGRRCSKAAPPASSSPWGCRRSSTGGTSGRTD